MACLVVNEFFVVRIVTIYFFIFFSPKGKRKHGRDDPDTEYEHPTKRGFLLAVDLFRKLKQGGFIAADLKRHLMDESRIPPKPQWWNIYGRKDLFEEFKAKIASIATEIVRKNRTRTNFPVLSVRGRPGAGKTTALRLL